MATAQSLCFNQSNESRNTLVDPKHKTHKPPRVNTSSRPVFRIHDKCSFHIIGSGRNRSMKSIKTLVAALDIDRALSFIAPWSKQCPPGMVLSQKYATGVHWKVKAKKKEKCQRVTNVRRA